jgi:hypothetical protein
VTGEIDPGAIRISDLDRELVARHLAGAMEAGRLMPVEYSERCQAAYAARNRAELLEVVADLPGGPPPAIGAVGLDVPFGQVRRTGAWPVPEQVRILGLGQRTLLDLTEARLERPELTIEVAATMSSTAVVVPAHARVDTDGLELVAGSLRRRATAGARGGGLLRGRRAARTTESPPALHVVLRGRSVFSTVTIWQPRPTRR